MKLKIVKIVEIICTCLAGIIAIGFSFFIIQKIAFENKPISLLGVSIYEVANNEIKDDNAKKSIDKGDLIIAIKNKNYKENDVVIIIDNDKYEVARVTLDENGEEGLIKYGIHQPIEEFDVIGKKMILVNNYSSFRQAVLKPVTIIVLAVVFFGGLITCFVLEKVFTAQNEKTKEEENIEEN